MSWLSWHEISERFASDAHVAARAVIATKHLPSFAARAKPSVRL
jgi:hypothetical protein